MKKILLLIAIPFYLISCDEATTYETVTVNDYSLEIPSYLSKGTDLHEDASLQYQNLFKELYIIVIDENKKEVSNIILESALEDTYSNDFKGYVKLVSGNQEEAIKMKKLSEKDTLINSLEAKIVKLEAKVDDYDIFYVIAYINGVDSYYQITSWTLKDKRKEYEPIMDKMIATFRLKNKKKISKKTK